MLKSKIEKCQTKLAKSNDSITKFTEEHDIDEIAIKRSIFNHYRKLKDSDKDSFLSLKNVTLDTCQIANRLYIKFGRLKKKKEKLEQELRNLTSVNKASPTSVTTTFFSTNTSSPQHNDTVNKASPTSVTTTFFSTNTSSPQHNDTNKSNSNQNVDCRTYLNDITKTLFASKNTTALTKKPTIRKKVRRNFILSKNNQPQTCTNNNTFDESIFVCTECNTIITNNQDSSTINNTNNQHSSSINQTNNNNNINNQVNTTVPIDQTFTDNINASNTLNNIEFQYELSSSQDNTPQAVDINYHIEGYFCHNCHRNNTLDYFILYEVQLSSLNRKKKFRFISARNRNNEDDYIYLCKECCTYFSNESTTRSNIKKEYNLLWPSFVWYLLSNEKAQRIYGIKLWQLLCLKFRKWWLHSVKEFIPFFNEESNNVISLHHPQAIFYDNTQDTNNFVTKIRSRKLGDITEALNDHLIPKILCPWGCSEYYHECGYLSFDLICQRFLCKLNIDTIYPKDELSKLYSARDDYIRFDVEDYDCWIYNKEWKVMPNVTFIKNKGPLICTCRNHKNGSNKLYFHPPRLPHHLPSAESDQLALAVIRPRTIKNFKAAMYSNSYQMHEQRGSFQGIDTCDICNFGDFSFLSTLLSESESRSISNRTDINDLLDKFERNGIVSQQMVNDMREIASLPKYSYENLKKFMIGATHIPLQDCLNLQGLLGHNNLISIEKEGETISIQKNWLPYHYYMQKFESEGYGAQFFTVGRYKNNHSDTRLLWILAHMLTKIPLLYNTTQKNIKKYEDWKPWMLSYITKNCFHNIVINCSSKNPFKATYINKVSDICEKIGISETYVFDIHNDMTRLFRDIDEIYIISTIEEDDWKQEIDTDKCDIIIITCGNLNDMAIHNARESPVFDIEQNTIIEVNDIKYELRFLSTSNINNQNYTWNGTIFARHGNDYSKWWIHNRNDKWSHHTENGNLEYFDCSQFNVGVYVKIIQQNEYENRELYMKYIGAQNRIKCGCHKYFLITDRTNKKECITRGCDNKVTYTCPELRCNVKLCRKCFLNLPTNEKKEIFPQSFNSKTNEYDTDTISSENSNSTENLIEPYDILLEDLESSSRCSNKDNFEFTHDDLIDEFEKDKEAVDNVHIELDMNYFGDYPDDIEITNENDENNENSNNVLIPTTNALLKAKKIYTDDDNWLLRTNGHVLLNQSGKLLNRKNNNMNSNKHQKHFIQNIAATVEGNCIPLLYPEGMLFPSIFWKALNDGSIIGAIPSCFMTQPTASTRGVALHRDMYRSRTSNPGTQTSTNPRYIAHIFDVLTNLTTNSTDSRLVLNRGLVVATNETGLALNNRSDDRLYDSVDSKKMVRNLCSSQKYHKQTFFLTFTCNQKKHPGIKKLKNYVDSYKYTKYIPNFDSMTDDDKEEVHMAVNQAIGSLILRNWMEAKKIITDYICKCPTSPFHPMRSMFARDEYQNTIGNLSHIHMMVEMDVESMSDKQKDVLEELIRAYICDIVRDEDLEKLSNEGIIQSIDDVRSIEKDAECFLPHKCSMRCLKRVAYRGDNNDYVCKKPNNNLLSEDPTKHMYMKLNNDYSYDVLERLHQIGIVNNINTDQNGQIMSFSSDLPYFNPRRHLPRTNRTHDQNISPVESKTFSAFRSMQNIQMISGTNGMNKYVCKYIVKIDESNLLHIESHSKKSNTFKISEQVRTNTKVTSSKIVEDKATQKSKNKNKPTGRSISFFQQLQMILGYPEIRTDLKFINVPTVPLEQRTGVEKINKFGANNRDNSESINEIDDTENTTNTSDRNSQNVNGRLSRRDNRHRSRRDDIPDGMDTSNPCVDIRRNKNFPRNRLFTDSQLLIMNGAKNSTISLDKISIFGIRCPELLQIIDTVGNYFRWFHTSENKCKHAEIEEKLNIDENVSFWIDGCSKITKIRYKAIPEIKYYLASIQSDIDTNNPMYNTYQIFKQIVELYERKNNVNTIMSESENKKWDHIEHFWVHVDSNEIHLPVIVFDYIKPSIPTRFILHILLSLGHFETEYDLLLHTTLRDSLRYAKLIGPSNDPQDLQKYSDNLLKLFIEEQLVYYPNGKKTVQNYILNASDTFNGIILRNEIPIHDMPPVLQANLDSFKDTQVEEMHKNSKISTLNSIFMELENLPFDEILSQKDTFYENLYTEWDPVRNFVKTDVQTQESHQEQLAAIKTIKKAIDRYCEIENNDTFVKCQVICGFPGSGKTFVELYMALYAISKGLRICMSSVMCKRSISLGGTHIHVLFGLTVTKNTTINRNVELALINLLNNNEKLLFLRTLNVLFLDEIGQISTELLCTMDIILRRIRDNDIFMGGILVIGTLDHKQLPPVQGHPFLTSPHVFSSYEFSMLKKSVRANGDSNHQRVQEIIRTHRSLHTKEVLEELEFLISEYYTFVETWNDPIITPDVFRAYGKKLPANTACMNYIEQVKNQLNEDQYIIQDSQDYEKSQHSLEDWRVASTYTREKLDKMCKEPRKLLFFKGAVYECTYNKKGHFSHTQLAILLDLPTPEELQSFRDIYLYVAPRTLKDFTYDPLKTTETYVSEGWKKTKIGTPILNTHATTYCMKAQRRQYGLKHYVTSTLHVLQGLTINKIASELNMFSQDYNLWDVAQLLVLLSRTRRAVNIIFVGNKQTTIKSIISLLETSSQWTDYMENVIQLLGSTTENDIVSTNVNERNIAVFEYNMFPLDYKCIPIPRCNTGFVYFLVSSKDSTKTYIGQTMDLTKRLSQHNSGFGTDFTQQIVLRPWIIYAFITGFEKNRTLMLSVEHDWKMRRQFLANQGERNPKLFAKSASNILINRNSQLNLLLCFK